jgi:RNA-directed DNA polymerase
VQAGLLSREIREFGVPTPLSRPEGNIAGGVMRESPGDPARSENQGMHGISMRENREVPRLARRSDDRAGRSGNAQCGKPEMNERGKSDMPVVPANPPNNALAAEVGEERGMAKGNTTSKTRPGHRAGHGAPSALDRVREVARKDKEARFTALLHHVDLDRLRAAYWAIRPTAAPGVDGVTWQSYGQELEANLRDLHARLHAQRYQARPSRRAYIPKADGRQRPLGIATLEDKIVQRAVVEVLNAVYEVDFLGFSYGFRPRRSPHHALDALAVGIQRRKVNWVLDADIREFFTSLDHRWLMKFVEHRIADKRVLRLIRKWLNAGVIENGKWSPTVEGAPQGASVSPLLANVYLHYVFDLWVRWWRSRHARGDVIIVRFADDFTAGFEYQEDAQRFLADLRERFAKFGLELHPDKTRLIEFGRNAAWRRAARGLGKPEDVRLPRLHAPVCDGQGRTVLGQAHHDQEADAGQAARGQRRAQATPARTHPDARAVAEKRGARTPRLLRRARQHRCGRDLPHPGRAALVSGAAAPQPAHTPELDTDGPHHETMATTRPRTAPLTLRALRRQNPRQEPSAVIPHAGICAGGRS